MKRVFSAILALILAMLMIFTGCEFSSDNSDDNNPPAEDSGLIDSLPGGDLSDGNNSNDNGGLKDDVNEDDFSDGNSN